MKPHHSHATFSVGRRPAAIMACAAAIAAVLSCATLPAARAQAVAQPAAHVAPGPVKVDPGVLLKFVRLTIIALDQANKTGNYTVLRDLGAPDFQKTNTAARLAEIFASERQAGLDMSSAAILDPVVTMQPEINADGLLHFAGYFPAGNNQLKFELLFQAVGTSWQLFGLSVNLNQPGGAAASAEAPPAAAPPVPEAAAPKAARKKPAK